jgi:hypothetical protein
LAAAIGTMGVVPTLRRPLPQSSATRIEGPGRNRAAERGLAHET